MINTDNLCMGCMNPLLPEDTICPHCGYDRRRVQTAPCLPLRTMLKQRYLVGAVTAKTNTAITYCGFDLTQGKRISIHEFFPEKIAFRTAGKKQAAPNPQFSPLYYECLNSFDELWKTLQSLNGIEALETPYDLFYMNNTVYAVTDYKQCITIRQYLDANGVRLSWQQACEAFMPVFDALDYLHRSGIIHAGINISTVTIGSDGKIRLSAPGIAQSVASIPEVEAVLQDGYAPVELYDKRFQIGPEADIYSLMAVMYICMTGTSPQKSTERIQRDAMIIPHSLASGMTSDAIGVLIRSLKVFPDERFHSMTELKSNILSSLKPEPRTSAPAGSNVSGTTLPKPAVPKKADENKADGKKAPSENNAKKDSGGAIALKAVISAIVIAFVVFSTLYTTVLYESISIPFLDKLYAPLSFLPVNQINSDGPTVAPSTTEDIAKITVAPTTTVPPATAAPTVPTTVPETSAPSSLPPSTTEEPEQTHVTSSRMVEVADFTKLTYPDIRSNTVFNRNFNFEYRFEASDDYPKNAVISQSIPAGQTVNQGTTIILVISTGPEKVKMPDVIGMDYEQAKITLESKGFKVNKEVKDNDGNETPGKVYTMSLVAGLEFPKGTEVTLVVWGDRPN